MVNEFVMLRIHLLVVALLGACRVVVAGNLAEPVNERNPFTIASPDNLMALARVVKRSTAVQETDVNKTPNDIYEVDVIAEFRGRQENKCIKIISIPLEFDGRRHHLSPGWLGEFETGDILFVRAKREGKSDKYEASRPNFQVPLGISQGELLKPDEVGDFKVALGVYASLVDTPAEKVPQEQISDLLKSTNFYSWSVAVHWITFSGSKAQRKYLVDIFAADNQTPRQIDLLYNTFTYFPNDEVPTKAELCGYFYRRFISPEQASREKELQLLREKRKASKGLEKN